MMMTTTKVDETRRDETSYAGTARTWLDLRSSPASDGDAMDTRTKMTPQEAAAYRRILEREHESPTCAAIAAAIRDGGRVLETVTSALLMLDERQRHATTPHGGWPLLRETEGGDDAVR
jgi:hypothetical protein